MGRQGDLVGIKDVARAAGVSVGTVSNVLNRPDSVSEARREQVLRAIAELGYVPNDAARQLKVGVSRSVGLIVIDARNPFYDSLSLAAQSYAEAAGLGLFVANSSGVAQRERFYLGQFEQQRARGVLVTPADSDLNRHRELVARGTRVVLVDAPESAEGFVGFQPMIFMAATLRCVISSSWDVAGSRCWEAHRTFIRLVVDWQGRRWLPSVQG